MHDEQFVLSELGRLYVDCRALVAQLQAAQKRISELEGAPKPSEPLPQPDISSV